MKKISIFIFLSVFILWSLMLFYYSPTAIADWTGIENAYILLCILAFLGGTSILFPFPYYLFAISFGAAGLNPLYLGLAAGIGTLIGDASSYYIAYRGSHIASPHWIIRFKKVHSWAQQKHPALFPILAFFYAATTPFPDDLLMVPAGVVKYPFWRLALGVGPGKVLFNTLLALSGYYGWNFFLNFI
jgi:membrane protein YqaA with SNARE-associated domain